MKPVALRPSVPPAAFAAVRAVTFDAGHTLIYPHPSVGEVYAEVMAQHGLHRAAVKVNVAFDRAWADAQRREREPHRPDWEWHWWRRLVFDVLDQLDARDGTVDRDRLFAALWDEFGAPARWRLFDPTRGVLAALRARGYRLGLLSNWDCRLRPLLTGLALTDCFEHLVISAEVGVEKPHPGIFRHAEERFGLRAPDFLHVGDSETHDIAGARAAGWHCLRLKIKGRADPAAGVIASLNDVLALLPPCPRT